MCFLAAVYSQISSLVSDINDMSYTNMPASLAKAYMPKVAVPPKLPSATPQPIMPVMGGANQWGPYKPVGVASGGGVRQMYVQQMPFQAYQGI